MRARIPSIRIRFPSGRWAGKLRADDNSNDWEGGPIQEPKFYSTRRFRRFQRGWSFFGLFVLAGGLFAWSWVKTHHRQDPLKVVQTSLELTVAARNLRQYAVQKGRLPEDPADFLAHSLRQNKAAAPGCDFWGHRYQVEEIDDNVFVVRSAGPDGKFHTRDDLAQQVQWRN